MTRSIYDYSRTALAIVGLFQLAVALGSDTNDLLRWVLGAIGLWLVYHGLRVWRIPFITVTESRLNIRAPNGVETFALDSISRVETQMHKGQMVLHFFNIPSRSFPIPVLSRSKAIRDLLPELTESVEQE